MLDLKVVGTGQGRKEPIYVKESDKMDKNHFLIPSHYKQSIDSVLIPRGMILDRVEKLAVDISESYAGETIHMVCVLKGSRGFFAALCSVLNRIHRYNTNSSGIKTEPPYIDHYVRLKSYHNAESSGNVQIIADDLEELKDKHVLVVEDIIDTGRTLATFCKELVQMGPKSLKIVSMLEKRAPKTVAISADFCGFSIPDVFIVGFCMDYNEMFRDLDHLVIMAPHGIEKYAVPEEAINNNNHNNTPN
jgi:hypoxanthine phosphoribosyltransferase